MGIPLQAEVTINWPGCRLHGAWARVVGLLHMHENSTHYIVHIPVDSSTLRLASNRVIPLDETIRTGIFDERRNRNETVSWRRLWHSISWWPQHTRLPIR